MGGELFKLFRFDRHTSPDEEIMSVRLMTIWMVDMPLAKEMAFYSLIHPVFFLIFWQSILSGLGKE